jgi:hypothetical protein
MCGIGYGSFARTTVVPAGVVVEVETETPAVSVTKIPRYQRGAQVRKSSEWWVTDPIVNVQRWLGRRR